MLKIAKLERRNPNYPKGEKNGRARLKGLDVQYIREAPECKKSRRYVCRMLSISETHWYAIRSKRAWKHV